MSLLEVGPRDALTFEHEPPASPDGVTFVGVNALSADWTMWENTVAARLRENGHGTLLWNFRGQAGTRVPAETTLDAGAVVSDLGAVLEACAPARPVLVGLSIGGLFAARAVLQGSTATGVVLVNTLRRPGPRLAWINEAVKRAAEHGGMELLRDLYAPLLFGEQWLAENRAEVLDAGTGYTAIDRDAGPYRLLRDCAGADWDVPWEALRVPVLVVTGAQDRVFRDPVDVDTLAARLPDARRVDFEDAGHMLPVERPARFAEVLLEFARSL